MDAIISFLKGLGILVGAVLGGIVFIGVVRIAIVWKREGWHSVKRDHMLGELLKLGTATLTHGVGGFFADVLWPYIQDLNTRMRLREMNGMDLWFITGALSVIVIIVAIPLGFHNPAPDNPLAQFVFSGGAITLMVWTLYVRYSIQAFGFRSKNEINGEEDGEDREELGALMLFGRKPVGNMYSGVFPVLLGLFSIKKETRNVFEVTGDVTVMHASRHSSKAHDDIKALFIDEKSGNGDPYNRRMESAWGYALRVEIEDFCQMLKTIGALPRVKNQLGDKIEGAMDRIFAHYTPAEAKHLQKELRDEILEEVEKLIQEKGFKIRELNRKIDTLEEEKDNLSQGNKDKKRIDEIDNAVRKLKKEIVSLKKDARKEAEDEISRVKTEINEVKSQKRKVEAQMKKISKRIKKEGKHIALSKFLKWLESKKGELAKNLSEKKDELIAAKKELAKIISRKDRSDSWGLNAIDLEVKLKENSPEAVVTALAAVSAAELTAKAKKKEGKGERDKLVLEGQGKKQALKDELMAYKEVWGMKDGKEAIMFQQVIKVLETGKDSKTIVLPSELSEMVSKMLGKMNAA